MFMIHKMMPPNRNNNSWPSLANPYVPQQPIPPAVPSTAVMTEADFRKKKLAEKKAARKYRSIDDPWDGQ